jgi:hypothetical protein
MATHDRKDVKPVHAILSVPIASSNAEPITVLVELNPLWAERLEFARQRLLEINQPHAVHPLSLANTPYTLEDTREPTRLQDFPSNLVHGTINVIALVAKETVTFQIPKRAISSRPIPISSVTP